MVMMIGEWSENERVLVTLQDVVGVRFGVQKVMSGDVRLKCAWKGSCVCWSGLFNIVQLLNCLCISFPLGESG